MLNLPCSYFVSPLAEFRAPKPTAANLALYSSPATLRGSRLLAPSTNDFDFEVEEVCNNTLRPTKVPVTDDDDVMPRPLALRTLSDMVTALRSDESSGPQLVCRVSVSLINDILFDRLKPECPFCKDAIKPRGVAANRQFIS